MSGDKKIGKCYDCKWNKQGPNCTHCSHPKAIKYKDIDCSHCGRKANEKYNGCGCCLGRGLYTYHFAYDECDIDKFEPIKE